MLSVGPILSEGIQQRKNVTISIVTCIAQFQSLQNISLICRASGEISGKYFERDPSFVPVEALASCHSTDEGRYT